MDWFKTIFYDIVLLHFPYSLQQEKERWQTYVDEHAENEWLLSNCMVAAAYLTYCGGMTSDSRYRLGEYFSKVCEEVQFPIPKRRLLKDVSLIHFLYTPVRPWKQFYLYIILLRQKIIELTLSVSSSLTCSFSRVPF